MKSRGMSQIITTVIMIGIVLVAVGVVWVVVQNIIGEGLQDVSLGSLKISMNIENVRVTDDGIDVRVKRNSGEANLVGLNFIVSDGEDTEVFEVETDMKELATQTFSLDYDGFVESVEVAPVLANDEGREKVYDSVNTYDDFSRDDKLTSLGIVSWWKLDDNVEDSIGENDGRIVGEVDCGVEGVYGEACEFEVVGNYVAIDNFPTLENSDFSIVFSAEPFQDSIMQNLFYGLWDYQENGFYISIDDDLETDCPSLGAGLQFVSSNGSFVKGIESCVELEINQWNSYVFVYDGDSLYAYVDGELKTNVVVGYLNMMYESPNLELGNGFEGKIDELMIFDKALTEDEVEWLYEQDLS
ncbi:MAG: LamG domain-containing protein [Candidatus Pacearchaeota archaeon]|nr:LamG domain-containing protein [Candidatus Pacearchaeota archaeon]